jgi:uncharacterized protein (DUF302 family)
MKYYFNKTIKASYEEVIKKITEALKTEGFGIVSEIRMDEKFKEKLNVDFRKYTILGACNPSFAFKAVQEEDKIGIMLPCNIVIQEIQTGIYEIAIGDPIASMTSIGNKKLEALASEVQVKLLNVYKMI